MDLKCHNIVTQNWLKGKHKQNLLFKTKKLTNQILMLRCNVLMWEKQNKTKKRN